MFRSDGIVEMFIKRVTIEVRQDFHFIFEVVLEDKVDAITTIVAFVLEKLVD